LLIILLRGNYLVVDDHLWARIRRAHHRRLIELLATALAGLLCLKAILLLSGLLRLGKLVFLLALRL